MVDLVTVVPSLVAIAVLVGLSAFFSSSESAIFSLAPETVDELAAETNDARATALRDLRHDPHRLLVTILVGNNVVNIAISSLATLLLVEVVPTAWVAPTSVVLVSSLVLVFGEIVPKAFGLGNASTWSLSVARPLSLVERALYPLVTVFDWVTRRISGWIGGQAAIEQYIED